MRVSRRRRPGERLPWTRPGRGGRSRGRKRGRYVLEKGREWRLWGEIRCGDRARGRLRAGIRRKSPCLRRGRRPRTKVFLHGAGGNRRIPRAFSWLYRSWKREKRRREAKRDAGSARGCAHSTSLLDCVRWNSGNHCGLLTLGLAWCSPILEGSGAGWTLGFFADSVRAPWKKSGPFGNGVGRNQGFLLRQ